MLFGSVSSARRTCHSWLKMSRATRLHITSESRLNFPIQRRTACTIRFAGSKLHRVIAVTEVVDKLHKNTRRNILADRDETEENIFHLVLIRAVAQGKVQIAGKHTGTQHKMRSQHIHIDRLLQEFLAAWSCRFRYERRCELYRR